MTTFVARVQYLDDTDPFSSTNYPEPSRPPPFTFLTNVHLVNQISGIHKLLSPPHKLEDCALQLYKVNSSGQGDYGVYLDLESTLDDQWEELEGFGEQRKNTIILRTQLSVRVHIIIEKLLNSNGRELRRALFSLKQIFQDDKDLVHDFVCSDGLDCLIKVGSEADQNHLNYILRALGQVMLYVDGMNGVITHPQTIQWLYNLTSSKFRLVIKTALKLLLVFVEYTEKNCLLLFSSIQNIDESKGVTPFHAIIDILTERDGGDSELCLFAMTLINKILNGIADQDTFYDITDYLEEQGMEAIIHRHQVKNSTDVDLMTQLSLYETALKAEDGDDSVGSADIRQLPRVKSEGDTRKSRRSHGINDSNGKGSPLLNRKNGVIEEVPSLSPAKKLGDKKSAFESPPQSNEPMSYLEKRRAERAARKEGSVDDQTPKSGRTYNSRRQVTNVEADKGPSSSTSRPQSLSIEHMHARDKASDALDEKNLAKKVAESEEQSNRDSGYGSWRSDKSDKKLGPQELTSPTTPSMMSNNRRWMLYKMTKQSADEVSEPPPPTKDEPVVTQSLSARIENLSQKPPDQKTIPSPSKLETKTFTTHIDMQKPVMESVGSSAVSALKDKLSANQIVTGLAVGQKAPISASQQQIQQQPQSDIDTRWEAIEKAARRRPLVINDIDFTELKDLDDIDVLKAPIQQFSFGMAPPPPPPGAPFMPGMMPPAPPPIMPGPPPPPMMSVPPPMNIKQGLKKTEDNKAKKTVRLHWKEVQDKVVVPNPTPDLEKAGTIWQKIKPASIDANKFEHLFESRVVDNKAKDPEKQLDTGKKIITVLDAKRSNAINIGLTKLPPPRTIKAAILKMEDTVINREGIEKLLTTMIPTDEERQKITEAQLANPDVPLGNAEQLLSIMSSISELEARLQLWAFKLDYESNEKEIAEPLCDLKEGITALYTSKTLKQLLSVLLSIGNFLNGANAQGFHIEYLSKVPEVKDTVHKHSLLHHLCVTINEVYPDSGDLYTEISALARCAKVDWDELEEKLNRLQVECRKAMDNLRLVAKHETYSSQNLRVKLSEFLSDCAERIIILKIVHNRMIHRFHKMLLFLGINANDCRDMRVHQFCKIVSEFALEYRTTREKVMQHNDKKKSYKERKKTRGKLIVDTKNFGKSAKEEKEEDEMLTSLLGNSQTSDSLSRKKKDSPQVSSIRRGGSTAPSGTEAEDTGDELLESAFRSAASAGPKERKERKRSQYRHRKSLRRTLKGGIVDEEGNQLDLVLAEVNNLHINGDNKTRKYSTRDCPDGNRPSTELLKDIKHDVHSATENRPRRSIKATSGSNHRGK